MSDLDGALASLGLHTHTQTHLWSRQSVTPAQLGWGSLGILGAPGNGGCQGMQKACMWRDWHACDIWTVQNTHYWILSAQKYKPSACLQSHKIIHNQVRYLRPLTTVAMVRDVSLICCWDSHVDLCTPWHVRTDAKQIPKLSRWQGRVFVLRKSRLLLQNKETIIKCAT